MNSDRCAVERNCPVRSQNALRVLRDLRAFVLKLCRTSAIRDVTSPEPPPGWNEPTRVVYYHAARIVSITYPLLEPDMRAVIPLLATCLMSGCVRPDYAERWPTSFVLAAGPQPGFAIKPVVEKQKPAVLVADDGSVCRTSVERFARTRVGKWISCDWALQARD